MVDPIRAPGVPDFSSLPDPEELAPDFSSLPDIDDSAPDFSALPDPTDWRAFALPQDQADTDYANPILSAIGQTGIDLASIPYSIQSSYVEGLAGVGEMAGELTGFEGLADTSRTVSDAAQRFRSDVLGEVGVGLDPMGIKQGAREGGKILGDLALIAATGPVGLTGMGLRSGGQEYHGARKEGATKGQAAASAVISGVSEVLFEKVLGDAAVVKRIREMIPKGISPKDAVKFLAGTANMEGSEEALNFIVQRVGQEVTYQGEQRKKKTGHGYGADELKQDVSNLIMTYGVGAAAGGAAPLWSLRKAVRGASSIAPSAAIAPDAEPLSAEDVGRSDFLDTPKQQLEDASQLEADLIAASEVAAQEKMAREVAQVARVMTPLSETDAQALYDLEDAEREEPRLRAQIDALSRMEAEAQERVDVEQDESLSSDRGYKRELIDDVMKKTWDSIVAEDSESGGGDLIADLDAYVVQRLEDPSDIPAGSAEKTRFPSKELEAELTDDISGALGDATAHSLISEEALAVRRQAQSELDQILSLDPSRMDSPEVLAMQRQELEQRLEALRQRREEIKASMSEARREAIQAIEDGQGLGSAVQRLRYKALEEAAKQGDLGVFDRYDIEARRQGERTGREFFEDGTSRRSLSDAASEYRDAMYAALPTIRRKAERVYDAKQRAGKPPVMQDGTPMTREEYVAEQSDKIMEGMNTRLLDTVRESQGTNDQEAVRKMDTQMNAFMAKYGVKADKVGFRGDLAMTQQGIVDEAAIWLSERIPDGESLSSLSSDAIRGIAAEAHAKGAPMAVFQFLKNEATRRKKAIPPPEADFDKLTPAVMDTVLERVLAEHMPQAIATADAIHKRPPDDDWWGLQAWKARKLWAKVKGQFQEGRQLAPGKSSHFTGLSLNEPVAQVKDKYKRRNMEVQSRDLFLAKDALIHEFRYRSAIVMQTLDGAIKRHIDSLRVGGIHTSDPAAVAIGIHEAIESGETDRLPPDIREVVQQELLPMINDLTDEMIKYVTPKQAATIRANRMRYLFRTYAAFRDADAVYKELDEKSKPYQDLLADIKNEVDQKTGKKRFVLYRDEAYSEIKQQLGNSVTEKEAMAMAEKVAETRSKGKVYSIIRGNLTSKESRGSDRGVLPKAKRDVLISRVLDNVNVQKILGRDTNIFTSFYSTIMEMSTDIAAIRLRRDLAGVYASAGLVSKIETGIANIPVNAMTLETMGADEDVHGKGVVFVSPQVLDIFTAVTRQQDAIGDASSRVVAMTKTGLLFNPGTIGQNYASFIQMVTTSGSMLEMMYQFARNPAQSVQRAKFFYRVSQELARPGLIDGTESELSDEALKRIWGPEGKNSLEEIRAYTADAIRHFLDQGGEFAFEFEQGRESGRALFSGNQPKDVTKKPYGKRSALKALKEGDVGEAGGAIVENVGRIYKRPDVIAKLVVWTHNMNRLAWIRGEAVPSEATKADAAKMTLETTQDPRTTIPIIRNLSRGKVGLVLMNFAGFTYQMSRNIVNAGRHGMLHLNEGRIHAEQASSLESQGRLEEAAEARGKAKRYALDGTERVINAAVAGYFFQAGIRKAVGGVLGKLFGLFDFEDDRSKQEQHDTAFRRLNFAESENHDYMLGKIKTVNVRKKKDSEDFVTKKFVTVVNTGNVDLYNNLTAVLRAAAQPGDPLDKMASVTKEMQYLFLSPSPLISAVVALTGRSLRNDPNSVFMPWMITKKSDYIYEQGEQRVRGPKDNFIDAISEVAPRSFVSPFEIANGIVGEKVFYPEDPRSQRWVNKIIRNVTSVGSYVVDLNSLVAYRFNRDMSAASSWMKQASVEYKNTRSLTGEADVINKYKHQWDKLMKNVIRTRDSAFELGFSAYEIEDIVSDKDEYFLSTDLPKSVLNDIAYGYIPTFEEYLEAKVEK